MVFSFGTGSAPAFLEPAYCLCMQCCLGTGVLIWQQYYSCIHNGWIVGQSADMWRKWWGWVKVSFGWVVGSIPTGWQRSHSMCAGMALLQDHLAVPCDRRYFDHCCGQHCCVTLLSLGCRGMSSNGDPKAHHVTLLKPWHCRQEVALLESPPPVLRNEYLQLHTMGSGTNRGLDGIVQGRAPEWRMHTSP